MRLLGIIKTAAITVITFICFILYIPDFIRHLTRWCKLETTPSLPLYATFFHLDFGGECVAQDVEI